MGKDYDIHEDDRELKEGQLDPDNKVCYKCGEWLEEWPDWDKECICQDCLDEELMAAECEEELPFDDLEEDDDVTT